MLASKYFKISGFIMMFILTLTVLSCSENNQSDETPNNSSEEPINDFVLTETDKDALLFMLEEEKLARDTYEFLDNTWSINPFANIKNSEQTHMNAVENLLIQYNIEYIILPAGKFENKNLKNLYNQFVIDGKVSTSSALQIGATIEDLDIVDLGVFLKTTSNESVKLVFENLQCGSRNHLRSFVATIENLGDTYVPQFLTETEYNLIITSSHEQCSQ
jgi:hypothetical protein